MCEFKALPETLSDDRDWFAIMNFAAYRSEIAKTDTQRQFWLSVFDRLNERFGGNGNAAGQQ